MDTRPPQALNRRALTSLFMFFSFMCLPLSGMPLHYARGQAFSSYEHWLMSVHNMSATIFFVATVIHLTLHWSALTRYIATKTNEYLHFKKEMYIALAIVLAVVGVFSSHALHAQ
jgi:succinate dehydrogenase hydrophobic anchor subunit